MLNSRIDILIECRKANCWKMHRKERITERDECPSDVVPGFELFRKLESSCSAGLLRSS